MISGGRDAAAPAGWKPALHYNRRMLLYRIVLLLHIIGATIWTGGHLVIATRILPRALRSRSSAALLDFEGRYEPLGMTALATQVVTGLWLASRILPFSRWFTFDNPASQMITIKLSALAITLMLALDARFRVIPHLGDENIRTIAPHILTVTTLGVIFVAAGVGLRTGGWW